MNVSRRLTALTVLRLLVTMAIVAAAPGLASCGGNTTAAPGSASPTSSVVASPSPTPVLSGSSGPGTIAFIEDNDLYVIQSDGTGRTLLARDARCAAWSPDGSRIAYGSPQGLFVIEAYGSDGRRVVAEGMGDYGSGIAWSPDGGRIVFSAPGGYIAQLGIVNADGSGLEDLSQMMGQVTGEFAYTPAWSPQGRIYFTRMVRNLTGEISSVSPDGSDLRIVTAAPRMACFSLSPDGKWLLLWNDRSGGCLRLAANGHGVPAVVLGRSPWRGGFQAGSSWSPGGGRIVFSGSDPSGNALFIVRVDGSGLRKVPNTRGGVDPVWQPQ